VRMRPSILPGLLAAVRLNFNYQRRDVRLFELGKAFSAADGYQLPPNEQELFGLVLTGGEIHEGRSMTIRELDFYDAKGAVEAALDAVGVADVGFAADDVRHLRKGQSAAITVSGETVGYVGRLSDEIASSYKFRQPVYAAEVNLQTVLHRPATSAVYSPLPKYPGIARDVSLLVKRDVTLEAIRNAALEQRVELCKSVEFVDVYEGKGMAGDERSVTIRLEYRSDDRTLVDSEVDALHQQIVENLGEKLGIKPRF
jgi:phenylalanyl-tRNA synthetase beta chain